MPGHVTSTGSSIGGLLEGAVGGSQSEAVRWVASWNWTEPSGSSWNTPSMTQTWKWKWAFRDEPNR